MTWLLEYYWAFLHEMGSIKSEKQWNRRGLHLFRTDISNNNIGITLQILMFIHLLLRLQKICCASFMKWTFGMNPVLAHTIVGTVVKWAQRVNETLVSRSTTIKNWELLITVKMTQTAIQRYKWGWLSRVITVAVPQLLCTTWVSTSYNETLNLCQSHYINTWQGVSLNESTWRAVRCAALNDLWSTAR